MPAARAASPHFFISASVKARISSGVLERWLGLFEQFWCVS
jgi:hypothetical protein